MHCVIAVGTLWFMAVTVEMHNTGELEFQRDVVALVEHVLADRRGYWHLSILGTQGSDLGLHILRAVLAAIFGFGWWGGGFESWGVFTLGALLLNFLSLVSLVLWIVLMMKAFQGVRFKLPLAGDVAESLAGRHI